jgi:hypothetical protein
VPRTPPFADLADGPAPGAIQIELARPKAAALGCLWVLTAFLLILTAAAFTFAANLRVNKAASGAGSLRVLAVVLGIVFAVICVFLIAALVKSVRIRQGLGFDERAVWWREGAELVQLPWSEVTAATVLRQQKVRGGRSSRPVSPAMELYPASIEALRGYARLMNNVTAGEPARPGLPRLRLRFALPNGDAADLVESTMGRFAPGQLANAREETAE